MAARCAAQCRGRLDAELGAEQRLGVVDVGRCGVVGAGGDEALDQQHMGTLVEDGSPHAELGQVDRSVGVTRRQRADHFGPDLSVDQAGDALAVDQQPRVELRTTPRVDPFEELGGAADVETAVLQRDDVECGAGRQVQHEWVSGECVGRTDRSAQSGEAPAQRAERIDRLREELNAELPATQWTVSQHQASEQRPRLEPAHLPRHTRLVDDFGSADQTDIQAHSFTPIRRRGVTVDLTMSPSPVGVCPAV